jgi:hypothetical protein
MKLSLLLEQVLQEDNSRESMLSQTVKNPETGQDITVKTALGYDKNHPARKAASKIYAQFMNKNKPTAAPAKPAARPTFKPKPRTFTKKHNPLDSDDGYDAARDDALTGGYYDSWRRNRGSYNPAAKNVNQDKQSKFISKLSPEDKGRIKDLGKELRSLESTWDDDTIFFTPEFSAELENDINDVKNQIKQVVSQYKR